MGHTIAEKEKLLVRVRLLKDQLGDIEKAFRGGVAPAEVLHLVTESRGLINGLMADVLEDHVRAHVLHGPTPLPPGAERAAEDLIRVFQGNMGAG